MLIKSRIIFFYLIQEITLPFFGCFFGMMFLLLMFQALRLSEFLIIHHVSLVMVLKLTILLLCSFLPLVLPTAFFLSVLIAFNRLSFDAEVIAFQSCGLHFFDLCQAPLFFSTIIVFLSFVLNLNWIPLMHLEFRKNQIHVANSHMVTALKEGSFNSSFLHLMIFVNQVDPQSQELKKVFISDQREPKNPLSYLAKQGFLSSDSSQGISLELRQGSIHYPQPDTKTYEIIQFDKYKIFFPLEKSWNRIRVTPHLMTHAVLKQTIDQTRLSDRKSFLNASLELGRRYANSFSSFPFAFLGVTLGTYQARHAKKGALFLGCLMLSFYWILQTGSTFIASHDFFSPFLTMQLPNLIFLGLGWFFYPTFRTRISKK